MHTKGDTTKVNVLFGETVHYIKSDDPNYYWISFLNLASFIPPFSFAPPAKCLYLMPYVRQVSEDKNKKIVYF